MPFIPTDEFNQERRKLQKTQPQAIREKEKRFFQMYQKCVDHNIQQQLFIIIYFLWSIKHSSAFLNTILAQTSGQFNPDTPLELLAAIHDNHGVRPFTEIPCITGFLSGVFATSLQNDEASLQTNPRLNTLSGVTKNP